VGCYFGGMLARAGVPVVLIGRARHMEAIARDGLLLEGIRVNERIAVKASTSIESARGARLVLLCVKTVDTETAARELCRVLDPDAVILSVQNGVDNVDRIFEATGIRAIPVAVYVAAAMTAPGRVTHTGRGDLILGHRAGWPNNPDLRPVAELFERAEVPCRISDTIETELWSKLAMNCAYNAISALTRARYGRITGSEPLREVMRRAIAEMTAVARADGVAVDEAELVEAAFRLGDAMCEATSSTEQDIALGRPTEIDSLNGFVARRGAAHGIHTSVNDTLTALVKILEQTAR
jgi:2-dehydropantoate 2-reductase